MSEWGSKMRGGLAWSMVGYGVSRLSTFITTVIIAHILVPAQFGLVAAALVFLALIELGSDLGMNATVVYEQAHDKDHSRLNVAFTLNLLFAIALAVLGFLLAPYVADLFDLSGHAGLFRLAPISIVFTAMGNIHDALLLREMDFRQRIRPMMVKSLVRSLVSIVLAIAGLGAFSLIIGYIAGSAAWSIAQWRITAYRPRLSLDRHIARSMAAYGGAAAALEVLAVIGARVDQVVVGRVLGPRDLGLYTIAYRIPETGIDTVSWTVSIVAFPGLSHLRANEEGGMGRAALAVLRYQALYALPLAAALAVLASPLVVVLFGANWAPAGQVMTAVCVMSGLAAIVAPLGDVFKALGRQRVLVALALIQFPIYIGLMIWAGPHGILAVAWVRAGAQMLSTVPMLTLVMRAAKVNVRQVLGSLRPALAGTVGVVAGAGAVRLLWPSLAFGPLVVGSVAALAGGLLALRVLAPGTISELARQLPNLSRPSAAVAG
jgi:PST family polysaccharide transporter